MKTLVTAALLMAMALPALAAETPKIGVGTDAAIQKTVDGFFDAWNRHDPKTMASFWTDDATLINPMGREAHGRADIEQLFTEEQSGPFKASTAKVVSWKVTRRLGPELVFCDGDVTIDGALGPDGSSMPQMKVHLSQIMERKRGQWYVAEARPAIFREVGEPAGSE